MPAFGQLLEYLQTKNQIIITAAIGFYNKVFFYFKTMPKIFCAQPAFMPLKLFNVREFIIKMKKSFYVLLHIYEKYWSEMKEKKNTKIFQKFIKYFIKRTQAKCSCLLMKQAQINIHTHTHTHTLTYAYADGMQCTACKKHMFVCIYWLLQSNKCIACF